MRHSQPHLGSGLPYGLPLHLNDPDLALNNIEDVNWVAIIQ
jgi:hypothetical protein